MDSIVSTFLAATACILIAAIVIADLLGSAHSVGAL